MASTLDRRAFIIGDPISHSRSPLIHRYWLESAGLAGGYDPVAVTASDLTTFVAALKDGTSGFCGGNVTIPHKEAILDLVDEADPTARDIGAANTLWLEDGRLLATNTDTHGFAANLDEAAPGWDTGKAAVILGAGGASRAVIHALLNRGFDSIALANRTEARARALADRFGPRVKGWGLDSLQDLVRGADLFVNTTSLGMGGTETPHIDFTVMSDKALVTDIVYVPLETPLLSMAKRQGLATVDGLGMLLHQAVPGFERWFGVRPQVTPELRRLIISDMETKA
ncbi:MAG: shikimate dehydrogenase [Hoeflea sp.]|uniref:shikimate dehydrogenase n=1 Tax=Hoeflea sp. TaxID=1940281 RepID=UPI001D931207|nr:shikimate dehydrogenase [Hoeflea sp.]MBU4531779.1 shikimate dehydrogenase [Alphaproteobacteria bacterium]MBU4544635.1 shikimate dehydrogenase [Alphaproteobacteria bacterium]MBU4552866.1 shikimate dehydrogenase [Alphaproteobacteria bacterium]MBV1725055.1 shikimate dehydrogenase [Hoeflea sp.]MBV1761075.1 shikimate dehydrogenase [Hoeflea sp.]